MGRKTTSKLYTDKKMLNCSKITRIFVFFSDSCEWGVDVTSVCVRVELLPDQGSPLRTVC